MAPLAVDPPAYLNSHQPKGRCLAAHETTLPTAPHGIGSMNLYESRRVW